MMFRVPDKPTSEQHLHGRLNSQQLKDLSDEFAALVSSSPMPGCLKSSFA
jgi:hypothetical protein